MPILGQKAPKVGKTPLFRHFWRKSVKIAIFGDFLEKHS